MTVRLALFLFKGSHGRPGAHDVDRRDFGVSARKSLVGPIMRLPVYRMVVLDTVVDYFFGEIVVLIIRKTTSTAGLSAGLSDSLSMRSLSLRAHVAFVNISRASVSG